MAVLRNTPSARYDRIKPMRFRTAVVRPIVRAGLVAVVFAALPSTGNLGASGQAGSLSFEVSVGPGRITRPVSGRVLVVASPSDPEPRHRIGRVGPNATPIFAVDVDQLGASQTVVIDETSAAFPFDSLADLPPGDYHVQAVLDLNRDLRSPNAPGNLYSPPRRIVVAAGQDAAVRLELSNRVPDEELPADTDELRFVKIRSEQLSDFHGRPVFLRAAVILPKGFAQAPERRYPLRVSVGGLGARYTRAQRLMRPGSEFRAAWLAEDTPRMLGLLLDGAGPNGDPYQINSANNGPYGDAVTQELIPFVEQQFRGVGEPTARVVDGMSTGGWVSLALQVFYPDFFNGAWSACPDGVDFRQLQLVNIYKDESVYVDAEGRDRPSMRDRNGDVRFTMRHEVAMENVVGPGNSWTRSGRQWGAWNAAYGPRGDDGHPVPLWDFRTGAINREASSYWEQFDLRLVLIRNWTVLRPKLNGKLNIWVGESDDYFLNNAVHLLDESLADIDRSFDVRIVFGPGEGHCWFGLTHAELMQEMGARTGARP